MKLMPADLATVGGRIRQARVDMDLDLANLSLMVKLADGRYPSTSYLGRVERGEIKASFHLVEQISRVTKKPLDYFKI